MHHEILDNKVIESISFLVLRRMRLSHVGTIKICKFFCGLVSGTEVLSTWILRCDQRFTLLFIFDDTLKRRVALNVVQSVSVRVATCTELETQPILESVCILFGDDIFHNEFDEKLYAKCVQEDNDICIVLRPSIATCLYFTQASFWCHCFHVPVTAVGSDFFSGGHDAMSK